MKTYPVMLDVRGRLCVVVGAGAVGLRRARALLAAGANVRLVAPEMPEAGDLEGVERIAAPYEKAYLAGAALVFACTDRRDLNARIAADARDAGALVNAADQPEACDFFCPAAIIDGDVVVAVGTGGAAPALAAELKARLSGAMPGRLGEFAQALRRARRRVRELTADTHARRRLMHLLAGREGYNAFVENGYDGLIRLAREGLTEE